MSALVSVKYVGGEKAVEVDLDGLGEVEIVQGQTVQVAADVAASLLEQPANWQPVQTSTPVPAASGKDKQ